MSVKNEAKLWVTPSGQVAPKLTNCNNSGGFGYAVGQLPLDTTDITNFLAPFIDSKYHPRFQTRSPQVQFIDNKWEKVGDGLGCNDARRPQIDFSNFADNSCPAISMVGPAQQFLKSTENLLDTNNWRFRDSGQINSVPNDIDVFGEQNVFKHTATTAVSTNQLSGAMCFNNHLNSSRRGTDRKFAHLGLPSRMKVRFRVFDDHEVSWFSADEGC